jgi:hypothetical protein
VLRKQFFLVCLLFLAAIDAAGAQAVARQDSADIALSKRWGTWSAANSNGRTFTGTWTGVPDASGAVTGTWTLSDAQGKAVMNGGWSAAKAPAQWSGAWRARIAGRSEEFSGTWTASTDLKGDARISDLFGKAVQAAVSGTWRAGNQSGAWSIRTGKGEGSP